MLTHNFSKRTAVFILAMALPIAATSATVVSNNFKPDAKLQELADNAALAGVNAMAANSTQPAQVRVQASISAVKEVIANKPGLTGDISASVDSMTTSVVLSNPTTRKPISATAHYILPNDG